MAVLFLAACSGGSDAAEERTTVPPAPEVTTTTNPYAVPDVIDAAYVNRVLAGLDAAVGDVVRMVVQAGYVAPDALERLRALYEDRPLALQVNLLNRDARDVGESFRGGNQVTTVSRLVTGSPDCIFAQVSRDLSAVVADPSPELAVQWVGLHRLDQARDPNRFNPTTWAFAYDGFQPDHSPPASPCAQS